MSTWRLDAGQIEVVDDAVAKALRQKSTVERVAMILACNRTMRLRLDAFLSTQHPDWTSDQIAQEIARRMTRGAG